MRGQTIAFPDYSLYSTESLVEAFKTSHARLSLAVAGLEESLFRLRARGADAWSIHEIILHLLDSEIQGSFRFRKVWAESPAQLPSFAQDRWVAELNYLENDSAISRQRALQTFGLLREASLELFLRAGSLDWSKTGHHPEYGPLTLRNLLELYADHGERHLEQILHIRKLLKSPIEVPVLLQQRLY